MREQKKADAVIVQRGNYFLGVNRRDKDGNVVDEKPPRWEPDPEGAAVVVCDFDSEKNETVGEADIFAAWDSQGIDNRVREKLGLERRNFPTPAEWYKWARNHENGLDLCDICESICAGYDCRICPIDEIKEDD